MENRNVLNYTLLRLLGRGGMAEVWYAENRIEKPAAVKILNVDLSHNAQIVERFRNEAKITVKLSHPNIRQVYDYDEIDGRPCMIMEYLEGNDLKSMIKSGRRFTDVELRRWWNQLASALNYTHAQGIVHRDIKPANIFIDKAGNVKLLDFGIAKIKEGISMTQTGSMMGTLMYMSPEQVDDSKHIGPASDIYSLAVTFVHLLSGKAPYDSSTSSDYAIRKGIVEIPLNLDGVPYEWQAFLRPYLAKNPAERPALREFGTARAASFTTPISDETMVGSSTPAKDADDEGTVVAGTTSAQLQPQSHPQPRKRRVWPWMVGSVALVVVACLFFYIPRIPVEQTSEYVDLGLPSGTKWRGMNEQGGDHGFYTYDEAVKEFEDDLPSEDQCRELLNCCTWTWTGDGYNVKGHNGNKIYLPAAGICNRYGSLVEEGIRGDYWSSTRDYSWRSKYDGAWFLHFFSGDSYLSSDYRCYGMSVRLVQD